MFHKEVNVTTIEPSEADRKIVKLAEELGCGWFDFDKRLVDKRLEIEQESIAILFAPNGCDKNLSLYRNLLKQFYAVVGYLCYNKYKIIWKNLFDSNKLPASTKFEFDTFEEFKTHFIGFMKMYKEYLIEEKMNSINKDFE